MRNEISLKICCMIVYLSLMTQPVLAASSTSGSDNGPLKWLLYLALFGVFGGSAAKKK